MAVALGGMVIDMGYGLDSPALVGLPFSFIGSLALFVLYFKYEKK